MSKYSASNNAGMKFKAKDILIFNLKFFISVALIGYLFSSGNFAINRLKVLITPTALLSGVVLMGIILLMASNRFRELAISDISIWKSFQLTLIGIFFNFFVPGGVGGDLVKGVTLKRSTEASGGEAAFAVVMDRLLGLTTMSALSILSFLFVPAHLRASPRMQILAILLIVIFVTVIVFLGLLVSSRVRDFLIMRLTSWLPRLIREKLETFHFKQKQNSYTWPILIRASVWSLLSQMTSIYFFIQLGFILLPDLQIPIPIYFFVIPIGFMLTAVPISPGGIGVGQTAFLFLFQKALNLETDFGSISATGFQFYQLLWGLLGAYYFVFSKKLRAS